MFWKSLKIKVYNVGLFDFIVFCESVSNSMDITWEISDLSRFGSWTWDSNNWFGWGLRLKGLKLVSFVRVSIQCWFLLTHFLIFSWVVSIILLYLTFDISCLPIVCWNYKISSFSQLSTRRSDWRGIAKYIGEQMILLSLLIIDIIDINTLLFHWNVFRIVFCFENLRLKLLLFLFVSINFAVPVYSFW